MDHITRAQLRELATFEREYCVSIYMPIEGALTQAEQHALRLRHLIDRAEKGLIERGLRAANARQLLEQARELQKDLAFFRRNTAANGLALLIAPDTEHRFLLPVPCPELAFVGNSFYVSPLVRALARDDRFAILAVSGKNVRLFRCRSREIAPVALPEKMPKSLDEALAGTELNKTVQYHTSSMGGRGGPPAAIMHGHGTPKDDQKTLIADYCQILARHLDPVLSELHCPVVPAAVDYVHPIVRDAFKRHHLLEPGVIGSPDDMSEQELHKRALQIVEPVFARDLDTAVARFEKLLATQRAVRRIEEVLPAACSGRIDTLFATLGAHIWGHANEDATNVELHPEPQNGDIDLLDHAVRRTISHGGTVFVVNHNQVANVAPVAAVLRW